MGAGSRNEETTAHCWTQGARTEERTVIDTAYDNGLHDGHLDWLLDWRSDYAWFSTDSLNPYIREYARGYRAGWLKPLDVKLG